VEARRSVSFILVKILHFGQKLLFGGVKSGMFFGKIDETEFLARQ